MENSSPETKWSSEAITGLLILAGLIYWGYYSINKSKVPPLLIQQLNYAQIPNFATDPSQTVKLNNGEATGTDWSIALDTDSESYTSEDFNGDGSGDIAAIITANGGGTGVYTYLVLFANDNDVPKYMTAAALGDRVTVNKISYNGGAIADHIFTADIITQGPNDPMCCGTLHKILQYKLQGNSLTQVSN